MHCSFSLEHYKECIELAKDKGYTIAPIAVAKDALSEHHKKDKVILMRHDIDWSLENAYDLANIEYDLGICSSYYVYLHSELYNALSPNSIKMMQQMKGMGHEIGLHADGNTYITNEEKILYHDVRTYSSHNPSLTKKLEIPHLLNPNSLPSIKYISDSGRNWREGCMCQHIGKIDKLHILVHPEWYVSNSNSRDDGINKLWNSNLHTLVGNMQKIKETLTNYCGDLGIEY